MSTMPQESDPVVPDPSTSTPERAAARHPRLLRRLVHTWSRLREVRAGSDGTFARPVDDGRSHPKVSVMVVTYNHERYIAHALDSILMQERDFDLEINVIDDASTDRTQEIVRGYYARYPDVIRCHFNENNVGHIATQLNTYRGFQTLRGEYFALLEGDDYWTDSTKLRKQVAFLDAHPEYVACGHDTLKVYESGGREPEHFLPFKEFGRQRAGIGDLIGLAAVFHLSSLVYRNVFGLRPPMCFADPYSCETTINMVYGQFGDFYHMPGYMSVYRAHEGGVFSTRNQESIWRFHLHGFDRFALYLGWRYFYWFVRAIAGFAGYVLTAHRRGVGPQLRRSTTVLFLCHLVVSKPVFWILHAALRGAARARNFSRAVAAWTASTVSRISAAWAYLRDTHAAALTYNLLVATAPTHVLRLVLRAEERWPSLRQLRLRWKQAARGNLSSGPLQMNQTKTQQEISYQIETTASEGQVSHRKRLLEMFEQSPLSLEDRLFNIGMYVRSSVLVKFLVMSQIYERIKNLPGCLVEFGTWWGQNLILLENLRAIHEPFNKQRVIIGFDTFEGYTDRSERDRESPIWKEQSYSTGKTYVSYLRELIAVHEGCNVLGHLRGNHKLIDGDVEFTAPQYFSEHPEVVIAFAYFDMALYRPTKAALAAIKPHLIPGSILLLDEFTWSESPGEAIAFKEVFSLREVRIEKCALYPSKTIVTII